jgi:UDP-glucose 4-epimerase
LKWLITGGCGFIGTRLVEFLLDKGGHSIRILDSLVNGTVEDLASVCNFVRIEPGECRASLERPDSSVVELAVGDIVDQSVTMAVARGVEVVVHLAANTGVPNSVKNPHYDCHVNVIGTLNCLEAARQNNVPRFVFASSGAPVGECAPPITEEVVPHPVSPYGAGKLAAEGYCSAYFRTYGVQTVVLRFSNVYGVGSAHKTSVIAKFIQRAFRGEALEIYGDGGQTRDFIYVDDIVAAILLAAETNGIGGEIFHVATNSETSVAELTELLRAVLSNCGISDPVVTRTSGRLGDVRRNFADISKARESLGWKPAVDLEEGLSRTVRWFLANMANVSGRT